MAGAPRKDAARSASGCPSARASFQEKAASLVVPAEWAILQGVPNHAHLPIGHTELGRIWKHP